VNQARPDRLAQAKQPHKTG